MKYIDTNVLIRLITNDVPELTRQAVSMVEASTEDIMVLDAVITEACFVLEFNPNYRLPRPVIYDGIYAILDTSPNIVTETHTHEALDLYVSRPKLDYVDCLLLAASGSKHAHVLTFDKTLLKETS